MDGQGVALDADVNVLFIDAWHFNLQSNFVLVFVDVHRRCERGGRQRFLWAFGVERFTQKTVHTVLQGGGGTERIPTGQYCHDAVPPGSYLRGKTSDGLT